MKKIMKIMSLVMVVAMMFCLYVPAFAAGNETTGTVTVYITKGMFTEGGYANGAPQMQEYVGGIPTTDDYFENAAYCKQILNISDIQAAVDATVNGTRTYYGDPTSEDGIGSNANVLDAIVVALVNGGKTPVGGWDSWGDGGYINSFAPNGGTTYGETRQDTCDGVTYDVYTGTGWQIAFGTSASNIAGAATYATNYGLTDGMIIVFDRSAYTIYYPAD